MGRRKRASRQAEQDAAYKQALGIPDAAPRSGAIGSGHSPEPAEQWKNPKRRGSRSKQTERKAKKAAAARAKAKRRRGDGLTPTEQARQAMERSAAAINASPRGTPAGKPSGYKLGKAPSSYRQGR